MQARIDQKLADIRKELLDDYTNLIDHLSSNSVSREDLSSKDTVVDIRCEVKNKRLEYNKASLNRSKESD